MSENKKREYLLKILKDYLNMVISVMNYFKAAAPDKESRNVCTNCIKSCKKAIKKLDLFVHIKILEYLYDSLMGNNIIAYSVSPKLVLSQKLEEWDTEEHYQEFLDELEEKRIYREKKEQEKIESQKVMQKAKEMGKKVEMVWDKEKKTVVPLIIEDDKK